MGEPIPIEAAALVDVSASTRTFEDLFAAEQRRLFASLCLITRDRGEAEELAQEAFVRVLERWDRVGTMQDPVGYLYRTAMNLFRKRTRRAMVAARRLVMPAPSDDPIALVDGEDLVERTLATLSPRQRAAVVLLDLLGFTSEEAATVLGIRASTVREHASVARAALRTRMENER